MFVTSGWGDDEDGERQPGRRASPAAVAVTADRLGGLTELRAESPNSLRSRSPMEAVSVNSEASPTEYTVYTVGDGEEILDRLLVPESEAIGTANRPQMGTIRPAKYGEVDSVVSS